MKEEFKNFVRKHPKMVEVVKNNDATWQKLYEVYDLYGEDKKAWEPYLKEEVKGITFIDLISWFKNIDYDSMEESVHSMQRVISLLEDLGKGKKDASYTPRPIFKHFED